jgi:hypothetical protein
MAIQRNAWKNQAQPVPYNTALVWGTGISPVHAQYGAGPPLRTTGREGISTPGAEAPVIPPSVATEELVSHPSIFGYTSEDTFYNITGYFGQDYATYRVDIDDRPGWDRRPEDYRGSSEGHPPWSMRPEGGNSLFRRMWMGARRINLAGNQMDGPPDSWPTETVNEGWLNKPASGMHMGRPGDSLSSAPAQIFMQTSDTQRYEVRNNDAAVNRSTDYPRSRIASRVAPQKLKVYSGDERHYDMFPFQAEEKIRPFWYRTAGTDDPTKMAPNEFYVNEPIQRVPPTDPDLGPNETDPEVYYGTYNEEGYYVG